MVLKLTLVSLAFALAKVAVPGPLTSVHVIAALPPTAAVSRSEVVASGKATVEAPGEDRPVTTLRTTWIPRCEVRRVVTHEDELAETVAVNYLAPVLDRADHKSEGKSEGSKGSEGKPAARSESKSEGRSEGAARKPNGSKAEAQFPKGKRK